MRRHGSDMNLSRGVTFAAEDQLNRVIELEMTDNEEEPEVEDIPDAETPFVFDEAMRQKMDPGSAAGLQSFIV